MRLFTWKIDWNFPRIAAFKIQLNAERLTRNAKYKYSRKPKAQKPPEAESQATCFKGKAASKYKIQSWRQQKHAGCNRMVQALASSWHLGRNPR
jgi:hypothetical protein